MHKNERLIEQVALERISRLYSLAVKSTTESRKSTPLSKRYVKIAREISSHYNVKMPQRIKNGICRNCGNVLVPGINCHVRISSSTKQAIYRCECGADTRMSTRRAAT